MRGDLRPSKKSLAKSLTVRLIKNSLYRQELFPVYLLSGQRGSGKTTTARVFAAAINCDVNQNFIRDPHSVIVPCLSCTSCNAMTAGNHPDFIEIDAASHTGVDNIRQIIESASFIPLLGRKKIYLIDEAHMLSKAAFNAFLKILEEPPACVTFMLATTEAHKVIDTVRSRCFQLLFDPLLPQVLANYLVSICQREHIEYDMPGLLMIAQESEGSVRDALNSIERIRLAGSKVTASALISLLGYIDTDLLFELFSHICSGNESSVLTTLAHPAFVRSLPSILWKKITELVRSALWVKHTTGHPYDCIPIPEYMRISIARIETSKLVALLELLYQAEPQFLKTTAQLPLLELTLMKMTAVFTCEIKQVPSPNTSNTPSSIPSNTNLATNLPSSLSPAWATFINCLADINDPLVLSIFKQGQFKGLSEPDTVQVTFSKEFTFFKELLEETQPVWKPILDTAFGKQVTFVSHFTDKQVTEQQAVPPIAPPRAPSSTHPEQHPEQRPEQRKTSVRTTPLDIRNAEKWKKAHMLLRLFPGTITEIT